MIKQKENFKRVITTLLILSILLPCTGITNAYTNENYEYTYSGVEKYGEKVNVDSTAIMNVKDESGNTYNVYCINESQTTKQEGKYKLENLEDQTYYSNENANKIRNILLNSYPYNSIENVRNLSKILDLTTEQAITATQAAIWHYSNNIEIGYTGENVRKLYDWYLNLPQQVIENAKVGEIEIKQETYKINEKYQTKILYKLSQKNSDQSDVELKYALSKDLKSIYGANVDKLDIDSDGYQGILISNLPENAVFTISIEGTQKLKSNAYFYTPKDGINSTQALVGIRDGKTTITAKKEIEITSEGHTLNLKKIDSQTQNGIPGAKFEISNDMEFKNNVIKVTTKGDGTADITGLTKGMWYIKETKAPDGYIPNNEIMQVYINETDTSLEIKNSKYGKAAIVKVDENQNPVQGSKFTLYKDSVNSDNVISNDLVSDKDGKIYVKDLMPGTYYLLETDTPDDYILNNDTVKFDVEAYKTTTITCINETKGYGILKIYKKDAVNNEQLGETTIGIYSDEDFKNLIKEVTTDKDNAIEVNDLRPGTYYMKELKAKDGYLLDSAPKKVTLVKNQTTEVVFYNSKNYSTAGNYATMLITGIAIVGASGVILITKRIKKKCSIRK